MRFLKPLAASCVILLASLLVSGRASAQVGSTTDIIMGQVTGPDGKPIAGARVEVTSLESQITRTKLTNAAGRYTVVFPDGGGSYRMQVIFLGFAPARASVSRQGDEDRLVADFTLGAVATVLQGVQVRGSRGRQREQLRGEPGASERGLIPGMVNRLPVDAGDLNALATLAAGVVGIAATDSTPASFSVAGQPADQNSITLDGLSFGAGSVPSEALRNTRVITTTYDVARGQFTGGQIASTTRSGTNSFQGSLSYALRDPSLEFVGDVENASVQQYTQNQLSVGLGGPIVKDKLLTFGAASLLHRTDPLQSLLAADPLALQRLGTNRDSVARFVSLLNRFGLRPTLSDIPEERLNENASALVRLDYNLGDTHSLMVRGDWRGTIQDASRITPLSVPHNGGNFRSSGGGGMISLTSNWGGVINELRAYRSLDTRNAEPYLQVPSGRVVVASTLTDGTQGVSTLQFGVNSGLPQESQTRLTEISNEISRVSGGGAHRIKLGMLVNEDKATSGSSANVLGTFLFNSLADFEAGRAAQFSRTLSSRERNVRGFNGAVYLGDSWKASSELQLTYGVRLEGSLFPDEPAYNPVVDSIFRRRTDRFPSEVHLSPRVGFSYSVGPTDRGRPLGAIRGGFGEFRGRAPTQLFGSAKETTGLLDGQSSLVCVGSNVPALDWEAFLRDPRSIPDTCNGPSQAFGNQRRTVTVFDEDFGAPRAWRSSLGFNRRFAERYTFSIDVAYARGVGQTSARDLNLDTIPEFRLGSERNRPVYAPIASIVPETGAISMIGSRLSPRLGVVTEVTSELSSDTRQATASLNAMTRRAIFNASYTFTRSRDQVQGLATFGRVTGGGGGGGFGGGGGGATTASNPNQAEWGTSDQERRHLIVGTVTLPVIPALELTAVGRISSGGFFTPVVGGDVNGDGHRNDRPFIFDPALAPDSAAGNGMARLLASAPERARDCIRKQMGSVAARNSCSAPWSPTLDLQANIRPAVLGLERRLTLSIAAINTLTGIDQLLNGSNLKGWGQPVFPDRTLLYVRGFDPVAGRFRYQVNEHFGAAGARNAFRVPFQLALQGRLALGPDAGRQQMNAVFGRERGGRASVAEFKERLARAIPNPYQQILELDDSLQLQLTEEQKASLKALGDSLQTKADTVIGALAESLGGQSGRSGDARQLGLTMRDRIQEGRTLTEAAVKHAASLLTPEQWAKVPKTIKEPFQAGREGQAPGQGRREGRERPER
ncbi:MAG: carboxypeptidase regulatory-like domain-containing protein [Acidobacteriota bacterium]